MRAVRYRNSVHARSRIAHKKKAQSWLSLWNRSHLFYAKYLEPVEERISYTVGFSNIQEHRDPINYLLPMLGDIYVAFESLLFEHTIDLVSWICTCKANRQNIQLRLMIKARKRMHIRTMERTSKKDCLMFLRGGMGPAVYRHQMRKFDLKIANEIQNYRSLLKHVMSEHKQISTRFSYLRRFFLYERRSPTNLYCHRGGIPTSYMVGIKKSPIRLRSELPINRGFDPWMAPEDGIRPDFSERRVRRASKVAFRREYRNRRAKEHQG